MNYKVGDLIEWNVDGDVGVIIKITDRKTTIFFAKERSHMDFESKDYDLNLLMEVIMEGKR